LLAFALQLTITMSGQAATNIAAGVRLADRAAATAPAAEAPPPTGTTPAAHPAPGSHPRAPAKHPQPGKATPPDASHTGAAGDKAPGDARGPKDTRVGTPAAGGGVPPADADATSGRSTTQGHQSDQGDRTGPDGHPQAGATAPDDKVAPADPARPDPAGPADRRSTTGRDPSTTPGPAPAAAPSAPAPQLTAALPTVISISPDSGPLVGGTSVTLTGTNLSGATVVKVGLGTATSLVVTDPTHLTFDTPSGAQGLAQVIVTTLGGDSVDSVDFTYAPIPTVTSVAATHGSMSGFANVTVTGTGFTGATNVTVGGLSQEWMSVTSDTTIDIETPAYPTPGTEPVVVITPGGSSTETVTYLYDYPTPTVASISVPTGPVAGGTTITVTGTGFYDVTDVHVGSNAASPVTTISDTSLTIDAPPGAVGAAQVVVTTPGGPSTESVDFTYIYPIPSVTSVSPTGGVLAGGTVVTLTGTGLTGATAVHVGLGVATALTPVDDSHLTFITPSSAAGPLPVMVITPGGNSIDPVNFTYADPPTATSVSPTTGPAAGGTTVTLTGTNFLTGATTVHVGTNLATGVTVVSPTSLTFVTPAGTAGATQVTVTTASGTSSDLVDFTYAAAPAVTSISPTSGPLVGGTTVTLTGTGLTGATAVAVGANPATTFAVVNATTLTFTTPAGLAGAVQVTVTTPAGTSTDSVNFTYRPVPVVISVSPISGPLVGGTTVTLTGTGFTGATAVMVGATAAGQVTVVSDTQLTFVTAPGPVGMWIVGVTTPGGISIPIFASFSYLLPPAPVITSLSPAAGWITGGDTVTMVGTNLTGATAVHVGSTPATGVTVTDDTHLTFVTPAGSDGATTVTVTTIGGTSGTAAFTYATPPPPVVSGVDDPNGNPDSKGPAMGGETLVINGTDFVVPAPMVARAQVRPAVAPLSAGVTVTFGGVPATSVTVDSATQLTVVTPAHAPGTVAVVVTTPYGTTMAANYTYYAAPVASGVSSYAPPGAPATVLGSGFTGTESVTIGGVPVPFMVVADGQLTVTAPAGCHGTVDLVATGPGGSVTVPFVCAEPAAGMGHRRHHGPGMRGEQEAGGLAYTGFPAGEGVLLGLLALLLGGGLLLIDRRRRATRATR
jgi:hypothetical protein